MAKMREIVRRRPRPVLLPRRSSRTPTTPTAQRASGEEIWEQTGGGCDAVVARAGHRRMDHGRRARAEGPRPRDPAFAVEPAECPLISEQRWGTHGVPGIGDGIIPPNLDLALMDGIVTASTSEALDMARRLAREEGMLCGPSSGINVVAGAQGGGRAPGVPSHRHRRRRHRASATCPASCSANARRRRARPRSPRSTRDTLAQLARASRPARVHRLIAVSAPCPSRLSRRGSGSLPAASPA